MLPMLPYLEIAGLTAPRSADVSVRGGGGGGKPRSQGAVTRLAADVRQWFERRRTIAELSRLDDRLLADIGIERADIPEVVRSGRLPVRTGPDTEWPQPHQVVRRAGAAPATVNDNDERIAA